MDVDLSPVSGQPSPDRTGAGVAEAARLADAGTSAFDEYRESGEVGFLDAAVAAFRAAVAITAPGHGDYGSYQSSLGGCLLVRYERAGTLADLEAAIEAGRQAIDVTPPGHPHRSAALSNLSVSMLARFGLTGDSADLDAAIEASRQAANAIPPGHEDRAMCLSNLSAALLARYERAGSEADLDAAVDAGRLSVDAGSPDDLNYAGLLSTFGNALLKQYGTGRGGSPDTVVNTFLAAVTAAQDQPDQGIHLSNLGVALRARFEQTGQGADLDAAVDAGRQAIDVTPPGHPDRTAMLSNLAASLALRFEWTGQDSDSDAAIDAIRQAVAGISPDSPDFAGRLSNLGALLSRRFERTGNDADLDAAITAGRQAAQATPPGHPELPGRLSNLGASLLTRFERTRDSADLEAAVDAERRAAEITLPEDPGLPTILSNFGNALLRRYQSGQGDENDLDAAVAAFTGAVAVVEPGHPDRPMCLLNLSASLRNRFEHAGDVTDLDAAISAGQQAVAAAPPGRSGRTSYLSSLGVTFFTRFDHIGDRADLDAAIGNVRRAVDETPPGDAGLTGRLATLGTFLARRFDRYGDVRDLDAAINCWRRASQDRTGTPGFRLGAARSRGSAAARAGRTHESAAGYAEAVGLLATVAWHGLDRATRQDQIAHWSGVAADAAASAIHDGRPERAVELLEQGRSVLWNQALNLRRDLTKLSTEHPGLSRRLDHLRRALDAPVVHDALTGGPVDGGAELRRRIARDWDEAVAQVRALAGFEHFLASTPYSELTTAALTTTALTTTAGDGAVVLVNVSRLGCHALIVTGGSDRPGVVPLPAVTAATVADHANAMLAASAPDQAVPDLDHDRHVILDVLGWLWDAIAEPVLTTLGHIMPPGPRDQWPRVWWSPTGALSVLPIHAAGHHLGGRTTATSSIGDGALDRVISSYAPTIASLGRARQPAPGRPMRHLTVGLPTTPGLPPLPSVRTELKSLARQFPEAGGHHRLVQAQATRTAVRAALPTHSWAHFACHAEQQHADPSHSGFALWDGVLTIADLAALPTESRDLAFLSGCQTAAGSMRHLDEAIHLAAAMQFLGYRHVIATQWTVADPTARRVADRVYRALTSGQRPDAAGAARAVHEAVREIRRTYPADPFRWAPYVHLGA